MKFSTPHPIARESLPFVVVTLGSTIVFCLLALSSVGPRALWWVAALCCALATCYVLWFFRHPRRMIAGDADDFVAPADGKIVATGIVPHPDFPDGKALRIAIFMSLFNVHINWAPCDGRVERVEYFPGLFLNAMDDKASEENERKVVFLRTQRDEPVVVKLVAGLIARRIVCPLEPGDVVEKGETIGLIRFGSRVELLLPSDCKLLVQKGMSVKGRETIMARRQYAEASV